MTGNLETKNISAAYGNAQVLNGVSIVARPGAITCILGANGAGKTSLIRAIIGLLPTIDGSVELDGTPLSSLRPHARVAHGVGCVPEGRKLFPKMTVEENLRVGAYLMQDKQLIQKRLTKVYETFPRLAERKQQFAGTMSGGEQAMVSIGRALMSEPRILLIDEPSLGLSPALVRDSFAIIRDINKSGISILLVEQNVRQTLAIADYGYVISQGKVVARGTSEELLNDEEMKRAYFGIQ
ncbi:ABC transporter ATP-binding protein [Aminobacter aganoensis]|uniref:Branched-chain amino acid transport system ATP-binding protein n=1 Tax=Aminobacter aganoensis TaxID=83264 RepID=A0A7X0KP41_9HYPH|nr:ABC transporter ATP-binding protein [Aminobacter aganoensis]MBB6357823.1 branched-chain amino acid transport system ATP-binding protein [Aminobacter aganoensis]